MKQLDSLGMAKLKPRKSTIDFLLSYSKNIKIVDTRIIKVVFSKN
ncbi:MULTISPECIES: hypothetical protein [Elizabethkingia]|uniref:Uncharacterized protein n=2 Tax=Elizabethkingia anophelis TaxID=1117645 RepID=A0A077EBD7_9FLAO|nr:MULTISPECIES: hypothetical protein [Elizabethkingia]AIL43963.1 hypothetical protein BD94_0188 [Elizabethkingia anophelis NUHP1]KMU63584.1 hypothetical protein EZBTHKR_2067 [Elizabethkingia anophelis]MCS7370122.1 hypothetical protein [Elizabethkingia anophelis]MCS7375429.1 hypothetical protein [Elizabethkingia anophelis]MCS7387699.1 hypothetical protein [Elizabethkingia anophelis]